jgi:hypothetical protein
MKKLPPVGFDGTMNPASQQKGGSLKGIIQELICTKGHHLSPLLIRWDCANMELIAVPDLIEKTGKQCVQALM